jgi:N-acetylmuramoyl-L-alanine amidase
MVQRATPGSGSTQPVGSGEHVVESGECIISLADRHGHFWETLWNHPDNADVRKVRGSPHVLLVGDRVHIPEITIKHMSCETENRHRFKRRGIPISFELLVEENGEPLSGRRFVLRIEGRTTDGIVPEDGVIKAPMMPQDREGELKVYDDQGRFRSYPLEFGSLDPAHTTTGAFGRLHNLGYISDDTPEALEAALRTFQKANNLADSGRVDSETAAKLVEIHGS